MLDQEPTAMQLRLFAIFPIGLYIFVAEFTFGFFTIWNALWLIIGAGSWFAFSRSDEIQALSRGKREMGFVFFLVAWPIMWAIGKYAPKK